MRVPFRAARGPLAAIVLAWIGTVQAQQVTLETLLDELLAIERLAERPAPAYRAGMASSHDPGAWFSNDDSGNFAAIEVHEDRTEYVLIDVDGPGVLTRIWSANPFYGTLRIYIDGAPAPELEVTFYHLMGGWGAILPFIPPLTRNAGWGHTMNFPIPYAQHVKVTVDVNPAPQGLYYQVGYRTYAPGTTVESFTLAHAEALQDRVDEIALALSSPGAIYTPSPQHRFEQGILTANGPAAVFGAPQAPGTHAQIRQLRLRPLRTDATSLRGILLVLAFDGVETVRVPLGDFFGVGPGFQPYASLPFSVWTEGSMTSRWAMPFQQQATLSLESTLPDPPQVLWSIAIEPYDWNPRSQYFHAGWRQDHAVYAHGPQDWNAITVEGGGTLVGHALHVANPLLGWWGEGDERLWIDGEPAPSLNGTGTEDFYGYAYCSTELFTHAYHALTRAEGDPGINFGTTSMNRWFIPDPVPFTTALRFDLEQAFIASAERRPAYDSMTYWYGAPGAVDPRPPVAAADLALPVIPPVVEKDVPGIVIEAEAMSLLGATGGGVGPNAMQQYEIQGRLWSRHLETLWFGPAVGDELSLGFDLAEGGAYCAYGYLTRQPYGGRFQLKLNDAEVVPSIDLLHPPGRVPTEAVALGVVTLPAGTNVLQFRALTPSPGGACPTCSHLGADCLSLISMSQPPDVRLSPGRNAVRWSGDVLTAEIVMGNLNVLRETAGDFAAATDGCLTASTTQREIPFVAVPPPGKGYWFVARGEHCASGTYEEGGAQVGAREAEIAAAGAACP